LWRNNFYGLDRVGVILWAVKTVGTEKKKDAPGWGKGRVCLSKSTSDFSVTGRKELWT